MLKDFFTFDAYTCGLECGFDQIRDLLECDGFKMNKSTPKFGYDYAFTFRNSVDAVIFVMIGLNHDYLYCSAMGHIANYLYDLTRQFEGRLMRADVKIDFLGAENFDSLAQTLISLADLKNIKLSQVGDWALRKDGRTLYVGSRASVYMLRLYEKFKQSDAPEDADTERVRLELEIKPDRPEQKRLAYKMDCIELIETSKTFAPLFKALIDDYSEKISLTNPKKISNLAVSVAHLHKQYLNTFESILLHYQGDLGKFCETLLIGKLND